jgi:hypothetical protein
MATKQLVHKGFLYSLYIEGQFIEYFDSLESAKEYVDEAMSCYKGVNFFVKPIAFYGMA